jgi:hypothetical protein
VTTVNRSFKTNVRIWIIFSLVVFAVLGCFDPLGGSSFKVGSAGFWSWVIDLLKEEKRYEAWLKTPTVLVWVVPTSLVAMAIGWVLQAIFVAILRTARGVGARTGKGPH